MNEDDNSSDLHAWIDPEMEARIVAMVLGEASDFEREELERTIAETPELIAFQRQIEAVHENVGEIVAPAETGLDDDWKLSDERRDVLESVFSGEIESPIKSGEATGKIEEGNFNRPWWKEPSKIAAALVFVLGGGLIASMTFFSMSQSEYTASAGYGGARFDADSKEIAMVDSSVWAWDHKVENGQFGDAGSAFIGSSQMDAELEVGSRFGNTEVSATDSFVVAPDTNGDSQFGEIGFREERAVSPDLSTSLATLTNQTKADINVSSTASLNQFGGGRPANGTAIAHGGDAAGWEDNKSVPFAESRNGDEAKTRELKSSANVDASGLASGGSVNVGGGFSGGAEASRDFEFDPVGPISVEALDGATVNGDKSLLAADNIYADGVTVIGGAYQDSLKNDRMETSLDGESGRPPGDSAPVESDKFDDSSGRFNFSIGAQFDGRPGFDEAGGVRREELLAKSATGSLLDEKDLLIRVTEKPSGTINFGAGYSSIDDLVGFADVNSPRLTESGSLSEQSLVFKSITGDIDVQAVEGDVSVVAGNNRFNRAYIGHNGRTLADIESSGDISVFTGNDLTMVRKNQSGEMQPDEGNSHSLFDRSDELASRISKVEIEGENKTKDTVIRREIALLPVETFESVAADAERSRLNYFSESESDFRSSLEPAKNLSKKLPSLAAATSGEEINAVANGRAALISGGVMDGSDLELEKLSSLKSDLKDSPAPKAAASRKDRWEEPPGIELPKIGAVRSGNDRPVLTGKVAKEEREIGAMNGQVVLGAGGDLVVHESGEAKVLIQGAISANGVVSQDSDEIGVIQNTGEIKAKNSSGEGGELQINGGQMGAVNLAAGSGIAGGGSGGTITVLGNEVAVVDGMAGQGKDNNEVVAQDFSISAGKTTTFNIPGKDVAKLNRVVSGNPAAVAGQLSKSGAIAVVDDDGMTISANSSIDSTGNAVISSLDVADRDFLAGGDVRFFGRADSGVENEDSKSPVKLPFDTILNGSAEYTESDGDNIFTRQFLGGANTLRGFDFRDVDSKTPGEITNYNADESFEMARSGNSAEYLYESLGVERQQRLNKNWAFQAKEAGRISNGKLQAEEQLRNANPAVLDSKGFANYTMIGNGDWLRDGDGKNVVFSEPEEVFRKGDIDIAIGRDGTFSSPATGGLIEVSGREQRRFRGRVEASEVSKVNGAPLFDPSEVEIGRGAGVETEGDKDKDGVVEDSRERRYSMIGHGGRAVKETQSDDLSILDGTTRVAVKRESLGRTSRGSESQAFYDGYTTAGVIDDFISLDEGQVKSRGSFESIKTKTGKETAMAYETRDNLFLPRAGQSATDHYDGIGADATVAELGYVQSKKGRASNEAIRADEVLRDLAWLNKTPERKVDLEYVPGYEFGTTDIILSPSGKRSWFADSDMVAEPSKQKALNFGFDLKSNNNNLDFDDTSVFSTEIDFDSDKNEWGAIGGDYYRPEKIGFIAKPKIAEISAPPAGLEEVLADDESFSTFSLNVSDVSFKLAKAALEKGGWPDADKIRIEEFVNAFDYGDPLPSLDDKVASRVEQCIHPFLQQRNLVRIAMRTGAAGRSADTPLNLTFLLDNSGSMERPDRQETVQLAFVELAKHLKHDDKVTLISFARQPRLLADKVSGNRAKELIALVENRTSEGGTNLEAALDLAFEKAKEQHSENAQNRIILLTDGAANLGDAEPEVLSKKIESMREAGIAFDAAGIVAEGLNDEILEALTRKGDGRYYLLDGPENTGPAFAKQIAGALRPSAKNVKVQVEFNPERVGKYKLLGFKKHRLKKEDFRNDSVDAAELAAEETGVAVYQIEPLPSGKGDIGSVSVRFRDLSSGQMVEHLWPIAYQSSASRPAQSTASMRVATAAAMFAAKLKGEPLGEVVELERVARLLEGLPESFAKKERVTDLQTMISKARELEQN